MKRDLPSEVSAELRSDIQARKAAIKAAERIIQERDADLDYEIGNYAPHEGPPNRVELPCGCKWTCAGYRYGKPHEPSLRACDTHLEAQEVIA